MSSSKEIKQALSEQNTRAIQTRWAKATKEDRKKQGEMLYKARIDKIKLELAKKEIVDNSLDTV